MGQEMLLNKGNGKNILVKRPINFSFPVSSQFLQDRLTFLFSSLNFSMSNVNDFTCWVIDKYGGDKIDSNKLTPKVSTIFNSWVVDRFGYRKVKELRTGCSDYERFLSNFSPYERFLSNLSPLMRVVMKSTLRGGKHLPSPLQVNGYLSFTKKEKQKLGEGILEEKKTCFARGGAHSECKNWLVKNPNVGVCSFTINGLEGRGRGLLIPITDEIIVTTNFYLPSVSVTAGLKKKHFQKALLQSLYPKKSLFSSERLTNISRNRIPLYINDDYNIWIIGRTRPEVINFKAYCLCGKLQDVHQIYYDSSEGYYWCQACGDN